MSEFRPPTELVVSNLAYGPNGEPDRGNRLRRYYPVGPAGKAVFKLPNVDETTAAAYTFTQPYPWVDGQMVANGNLFPSGDGGTTRSSSNLVAQTIDKVFYGGHVYTISAAEVTGLSLFLTANGYTPGDWIT